nr:general transcription factor IIH subunit 5 [Manis javanica]
MVKEANVPFGPRRGIRGGRRQGKKSRAPRIGGRSSRRRRVSASRPRWGAPSPPSLLPAERGLANARAHEPGLPFLPARHADSARPQRLTADPVGGEPTLLEDPSPRPLHGDRRQATRDPAPTPRLFCPVRAPPPAGVFHPQERRRRESVAGAGALCRQLRGAAVLHGGAQILGQRDLFGKGTQDLKTCIFKVICTWEEMVNVLKGVLIECDPAMKQFLLHLDESNALGKKFIIQDIDDTHVFVIAELVNVLQERVGELMDQNAFSLTQK